MIWMLLIPVGLCNEPHFRWHYCRGPISCESPVFVCEWPGSVMSDWYGLQRGNVVEPANGSYTPPRRASSLWFTHTCMQWGPHQGVPRYWWSCATRAARNSLAFQGPGRQERTHSRLGRWFDGNIPTVFTLPQSARAPISDAKPAANEATKLIFSIHCWSSLYSHLCLPSPCHTWSFYSTLALSLSRSPLFVQLRWCRIPAPICKKIRILNAI